MSNTILFYFLFKFKDLIFIKIKIFNVVLNVWQICKNILIFLCIYNFIKLCVYRFQDYIFKIQPVLKL